MSKWAGKEEWQPQFVGGRLIAFSSVMRSCSDYIVVNQFLFEVEVRCIYCQRKDRDTT